MAESLTNPRDKNDTNEANLRRVFADSSIGNDVKQRIENLIALHPEQPLSIIQLDMDKSVEIRKSGITVKIAVLQEISSLLKAFENNNCIVISHGTRDDATIIRVGTGDPAGEADFISAVLTKLAQTPVGVNLPQGAFRVTYSAGIALYPATAKSAAELLELADGAVRYAKDHGRNTFAFAETGYRFFQQGILDVVRWEKLHQISAETGLTIDALIREGYELLFQKHAALYRFCDQEQE